MGTRTVIVTVSVAVGGSVCEAVTEGVISVREPVQAAVSNESKVTKRASFFIDYLLWISYRMGNP